MDTERWLAPDDMEDFLRRNSKRIAAKDLQAGDIAVYRAKEDERWSDDGYDAGELVHTALIVEPKHKLVLHKPGACPIEVAPHDSEYSGVRVTYRRLKVLISPPGELF